jgi:hypothetical protein
MIVTMVRLSQDGPCPGTDGVSMAWILCDSVMPFSWTYPQLCETVSRALQSRDVCGQLLIPSEERDLLEGMSFLLASRTRLIYDCAGHLPMIVP